MSRNCIHAFGAQRLFMPLALAFLGWLLLAALAQGVLAQTRQASAVADSVKRYKPCPKCGVANLPEARFCYSCGAALEAGAVPAALPDSARGDISHTGRCPVCGTVRNPPEADFCSYCGLSFTGTPNPGALLKIESGPKRKPVVAFGLSLLLPGGGQFYNGQPGKGRLFLGSYLTGWGLLIVGFGQALSNKNSEDAGKPLALAGLVVGGVSWLLSMIDAPASASEVNRRRGYSYQTRPGAGLVFVPSPRNFRNLQPGVGLRAGF